MNQNKKTSGKVISIVLSLLMTLSCFSGLSLTAFAANDYAALVPTAEDDAVSLAAKQVTFNGIQWHIIDDASISAAEGSLTLLAAEDDFGRSKFGTDNDYAASAIKQDLDALTTSSASDLSFVNVVGAIRTTALGKLYLLSQAEAEALPQIVRTEINFPAWWLSTPNDGTSNQEKYVYVETSDDNPGRIASKGKVSTNMGVRPALQLDLSKVDYDSATKTFTVTVDAQIAALAEAQGINIDDYYLIPTEDMYPALGESWSNGSTARRVPNEYRIGTKVFTANELPTGSLIFTGAYYRVNVSAFYANSLYNDSNYFGSVSGTLKVIDDEFDWRGTYDRIGFNVEKYAEDITKEVMTDEHLASIGDSFRLYIPKTDNPVAEFNGDRYERLIDAIRAAGEGDTVKLLRNAQESVELKAGVNVTLDLNGLTLTNDGPHSTIIAQKGSTLVVIDTSYDKTGVVDNTAHQCAPIFNNGGTVTLNGGAFTRSAEGTEGKNNTYYTVVNRGDMTINPGVIVDNNDTTLASLIENGYNEYSREGKREIGPDISLGYHEEENSAAPTLTINGGTFIGGNQALKNDFAGVAVINDGTFSSTDGNAVYTLSALTVNGGTFTAAAEGKSVLYSATQAGAPSGKPYHTDTVSGNAVVTGGTFNGVLNKDEGALIAVSGGLFTEAVPEDCCAAEFKPLDNGDGTYGVTKKLFTGHSISLNGDVDVNFYLELTDEQVTEGDGVVVTYEWENGTASYTVGASDFVDGRGFKTIAKLPAAEMNYSVTATVTIDGVEQTETNTYSVRDYALAVIADPSSSETLVTLMKTMLDYGAKAQDAFGRTDVAYANEGVDYTMGAVSTDMIDDAIAAANVGDTSDDLTDVASLFGAKYYTSSLVFLYECTLRHYFVPNGGTLDESLFDGVKSGYYYYVEQTDIAAADLDALQTFTVGGVTFKYSALDFVKAIMAACPVGSAQYNLAAATYWYNQAANAHFA